MKMALMKQKVRVAMSAGNDQNYGCRGGVEAPNQQPLKIKTIEIDPTVPGGYFNRSMDMRLMFVQPQPTEGAIAQAFTRLASVNGYTRLLEESQQTTKVYSTSKRWVLLCETNAKQRSLSTKTRLATSLRLKADRKF
jgi:hypothetical protein